MKPSVALKKIENYLIGANASIRQAVKKMDAGGMGFICVADSNKRIKGIITDGDFRRAVCSGISLEKNVMDIANQNFVSVDEAYSKQEVKEIFSQGPVEVLPVLQKGKIKAFLSAMDYMLEKDLKKEKSLLPDIPVVVMAGGKGTRLDPLTRVLPKPLIPLGDKTVIELIMDRFAHHGIRHFYVSLHHKSRMIRAFFEELNCGHQLHYLEESRPLGTAGGLTFLRHKVKTPFFVTNCDVLINCNYSQIYQFHHKHQCDMTIVAAMQPYQVPYGICHIDKDSMLTHLVEKPQYDFLINAGMYLLKPEVLSLIKPDKPLDMTDLIKILRQKRKKVGIFPISEKSWIDIGQLEYYKRSLEQLDEGRGKA